MCFRKAVPNEKQLSFFEIKNDVSQKTFYEGGDEFLSLLEEVLNEVFLSVKENPMEQLEERSIYDLGGEDEICMRENEDGIEMNEGSAALNDFESLLKEAEKLFSNPPVYPTFESHDSDDWITGFIQILQGHTYDQFGKIIEGWKTIGNKVIIQVSDLSYPEKIVKLVKAQGFKWDKKIIRVIFYGEPLSSVLNSRSYRRRERRELIPLCKSYEKILLSIPDHRQSKNYFDRKEKSQFENDLHDGSSEEDEVELYQFADWHFNIDSVLEDELDLVETEDIHEATRHREEAFELLFEEWYKGSDFGGAGKESTLHLYGKASTSKEKDRDSLVDKTVHQNTSQIEKNIPAAFLLGQDGRVKPEPNQLKLAKEIIHSINRGNFIDIELLGFLVLDSIFYLLWTERKLQIIPQRKDVYFQLKERFLLLRSRH